MRKILSLCSIFMLVSAFAVAQTRTVSGKVTESSDGSPMAGLTISLNGKPVSSTNQSGEFSCTVPTSAKKLTFSSIGYASMDVTITDGPMYVKMEISDVKDISEVVVTGYSTVIKSKYAGATANISAAEVKKQPFGSFDQAMQGQAAGVSVSANSGQPGANAVVRIRGNGSINGSNVPLYIMDGIEISAANFATMNQGDFERIEVLKDAVATAMYGSRGANGVIVISTRKGRNGQLQMNYNLLIGSSKLPEDRLIVMNSQQKIDYELQRGNPYGWTTAEADSLRKVNFNWKDELFRTAITQQHMISASAGNQSTKVYASLSFMDQEGTVKTTGLKRYTGRVNIDNNVNNWRFGLNLQGGYSKTTGTSESNTFLSSPLNAIRWSNPYERAIDPRTGDYQETGGSNTGQLGSGQPNGAMELFLNHNYNLQIKGVATSYLEFHFPSVKGLYARTNWGIDYTQDETEDFTNPRVANGIARQGALSRNFFRNLRYTGTTSLNYGKAFGKHDISGGVYFEAVKNNSRSFGFTGYGFTNGFTNEAGLTAGSASNPSYIPLLRGNGTFNGIQSYFAAINYGYNDKYYVNVVGRRDGSSRFGFNNRFANFGSVGLTWAVTKERFMDNVDFVNDLKLRASYGSNGNNGAGDFPIPIFARSTYAGTSGWAPGSPGNLDLRWETNRTSNIGLDFAILNRRISGTVEVYKRETKDLFYGIPIDNSISGFGSIDANVGTIVNKGVELSLRGNIVQSRDFKWFIEGNITYNQNRITDLLRDSTITGLTILAKGHPLNSLYLVKYAGVDPANGNAMYFKRDGTQTAAYSVNDKVILGTSDAPWYGGISTSVEYKGFDLSAQLNFFLNRVMYNNDQNNLTNPVYYWDNMHVELLKEWTKPGDITNVPRPTAGTNGGTAPANTYRSQTTRFMQDASFWRLRNVTLGYTLPSNLLAKAKIKSARVFIQGQNWWTATNFLSFDPEMTGVSNTGAQYPAMIQTTVGLSIGF
jgi:TonB-dependent starch-binding outer membrane protein SusC